MKKYLALFTFILSSNAFCADIVLTNNSIGNLPLKKGVLISVQLVQQKFPNHKVTHKIISGISDKHHHIKVSSSSDKFIFTIRSFFDNNINQDSNKFDVDQLVVYNPAVIDEFGVRVGDNINKAIRLRGSNLEFLAPNYFTNAIGKDYIYYQFQLPPLEKDLSQNGGNNTRDPKSVTYEEAIKNNPKIRSISWPAARWE